MLYLLGMQIKIMNYMYEINTVMNYMNVWNELFFIFIIFIFENIPSCFLYFEFQANHVIIGIFAAGSSIFFFFSSIHWEKKEAIEKIYISAGESVMRCVVTKRLEQK